MPASHVIVVLAVAAAASACAGGDRTTHGGPRRDGLVAAPALVRRECMAAARAVGYPVPCPTRLLPDMRPFGGDPSRGPRCQSQFIAPARCSAAWRGWVVGSSIAGDDHLVIVASPRPVRGYAHVINGPAWYAGARERVGGWITVHGWHARLPGTSCSSGRPAGTRTPPDSTTCRRAPAGSIAHSCDLSCS